MHIRCSECHTRIRLDHINFDPNQPKQTGLAIIINCPECGHEIKVAIARANNMVGPQETKGRET